MAAKNGAMLRLNTKAQTGCIGFMGAGYLLENN